MTIAHLSFYTILNYPFFPQKCINVSSSNYLPGTMVSAEDANTEKALLGVGTGLGYQPLGVSRCEAWLHS